MMAEPVPAIHVRIGSRGSRLALWQAGHIADRLRGLGLEVDIEIIQTSGDLNQVSDFGSMGAKGLFVKEIEEALLEGRIDLAVHSLKDLPTELPPGLVLGAVTEREDPRDAFVSHDGTRLEDLPKGAEIATGSLRRQAQALALRPDLVPRPLRGNVPTRLRKIQEGQAAGTFLAHAGLRRLGLAEHVTQVFDPERMTPPMGQGALGLETREGELRGVLAALEHPETRRAVQAERTFIGRIGGGCRTPAGVLARNEGGVWRITGLIASASGASLIRRTVEVTDPEDLDVAARDLAEAMVAEAGPEILETLHQPGP